VILRHIVLMCDVLPGVATICRLSTWLGLFVERALYLHGSFAKKDAIIQYHPVTAAASIFTGCVPKKRPTSIRKFAGKRCISLIHPVITAQPLHEFWLTYCCVVVCRSVRCTGIHSSGLTASISLCRFQSVSPDCKECPDCIPLAAHLSTYAHILTYTHKHRHRHRHRHTHTCTHKHIHKCTHTHTLSLTHTHIHMICSCALHNPFLICSLPRLHVCAAQSLQCHICLYSSYGCVCACVCVSVCLWIDTHISLPLICLYTSLYIYICLCMCICHICAHVCTYIYIYIHLPMNVYLPMYLCVMTLCRHAYIHLCIHAWTDTWRQSLSQRFSWQLHICLYSTLAIHVCVCLCMCVFVCVCVCVCVCVYVCECMFLCSGVRASSCAIFVRVCVLRARACVCVCVCVYVHICVHVCVYVFMCCASVFVDLYLWYVHYRAAGNGRRFFIPI